MPMTNAPFYAIYAGNRDFEPFSSADQSAILDIVSEAFPSFTTTLAYGVFEGRQLPTLVIQIASHDREAVERTCRRLGSKLGQRWVGLAAIGSYTSIPVKEGA